MIAEAFLKKREEKGRREKDAKWRAWYEANREHLNGTTPPPFMRGSDGERP